MVIFFFFLISKSLISNLIIFLLIIFHLFILRVADTYGTFYVTTYQLLHTTVKSQRRHVDSVLDFYVVSTFQNSNLIPKHSHMIISSRALYFLPSVLSLQFQFTWREYTQIPRARESLIYFLNYQPKKETRFSSMVQV